MIEKDGAEHFPSASKSVLDDLRRMAAQLSPERAGSRLFGCAALPPLLEAEGIVSAISACAKPGSRPVRALFFDKTADTNWTIGWHQDRTIAVSDRREVSGFGSWTIKNGVHHVAPPFDLLAEMVTVRVHLDDVAEDNAPLLIAKGSHRFGKIPEDRIAEIVARCPVHQCLAEAGDVWLYATPILHASRPAARPTRRRVLQVDYSAAELPGGLEWLGI